MAKPEAKKEDDVGRGVLDEFKLSETQLLKVQNLQLKDTLLGRELENLPMRQKQLQDERKAVSEKFLEWQQEVNKEFAVDLSEYNVNFDTGECKKREIKPA